MFFHLSLFTGRTESLKVESSSHTKLIDFFTTFSTSIIRNIKRIRYSKELFINYTDKTYLQEEVYKKVIVTALSENYSKIYTLFDIKKSVTEDILKSQFMKLYIKDEPIIDFAYIEFFSEGVLSPIDINNLYQVSYKRNNKTKVEDIYAPSWEVLLDVVDNIIGGEIIEIREYLYCDYSTFDFSSDVNKNQKVRLIKGQNSVYSFTIPKVKKTKTLTADDIKNTFEINDSLPDRVDFY